jgi:hypothetical protein
MPFGQNSMCGWPPMARVGVAHDHREPRIHARTGARSKSRQRGNRRNRGNSLFKTRGLVHDNGIAESVALGESMWAWSDFEVGGRELATHVFIRGK